MKSFLNLTVILLCSFINANFALSSSKTIPNENSTLSTKRINTTKTTVYTPKSVPTYDISYYTVTFKSYKSSMSTVLPNTVKVDPDSYSCSKSIASTTVSCNRIINYCPDVSYYTSSCDFAEKTTIYYSTLPVTTKKCEIKSSTCKHVKQTEIVNKNVKTIPNPSTALKYVQGNSGNTNPTSTGETITSTIIDRKNDITTIIGDIYRTIIKPYYKCEDVKLTQDCVYTVDTATATTTTFSFPPKTTTSHSFPPKTTTTTTTTFSFPPKTTTSHSFPPKTTTTTTTVSFPPKTTTSYSFPPKTTTTTTTTFSFPPKTTTSYSYPPKTTTTTTTTFSFPSKTTTSYSYPPKTTTTTTTTFSFPPKTTTSHSFPPKTTTTTTTTVSFPPKTTTTTTTTTTLPPKSTKCIPVTITVTEKSKTTITLKETVTVTVKAGPSNVNDKNCAEKWAQCGGIGFNGPTCCKSGSTCQQLNQYYSQCI